ncbi:MAG: hypothetical protein ACKVPX_04555 [Myxococcaceae bacterium]
MTSGKPVRTIMKTLAAEVPQRIFLYIGGVDVDRLDAYLVGYSTAAHECGVIDPTFGDFLDWLRDVKKEHPFDGWPRHFLKQTNGDQAKAIGSVFARMREYLATTPD